MACRPGCVKFARLSAPFLFFKGDTRRYQPILIDTDYGIAAKMRSHRRQAFLLRSGYGATSWRARKDAKQPLRRDTIRNRVHPFAL